MTARRFDPSSTPVTVALVLLLNGLFYTAFVAGEDKPNAVAPTTVRRTLAAKPLVKAPKEPKGVATADADFGKPLEDEPAPLPPPMDMPAPRAAAPGGTVLWTERKLSEVSLSIPASFGTGVTTRTRGKVKRDGGDDLPFVRVTVEGDDEIHGVPVLSDAGNPTPYILIKDILGDTNEHRRIGDLLNLTITSAQPRTRRSPGKVGNGSLHLSLGSLTDLKTRSPLTLHLAPGGWESNPASGSWLALPPSREGNDTISIHLQSGEDLDVFLPLIRAAQGMTAVPGGTVDRSQEGYCFVRRGEVVATIWGAPLATETWAKIASGLKASLIYRGAASAFIMSPRFEPEFQKKLAQTNAIGNEPIYVYDARPGDGRYPVLPGTLLAEPEIAAYLQHATGLFNRPVQLMSTSAMLAH
ncbi:MAG: hypothetical protein FJ146_09655 [Deltaproteobacteria bacterium]|nr:hypothetical protein [Deltaproteobacteria bacterium]